MNAAQSMLLNCEPWSEWISTRCFGLQRLQHHIGGLPALHRPAHNAAGVKVDHDRQIGEAYQGADIGDVCHPGPVGRRYIELAIQRVVDHQGRLAAIAARPRL